MRNINLLYVITKLELGGAQKQLLSLIRHSKKERFCLFLFTAKEGLLLPEALSISRLIVKKSRYLECSLNPLKDLLALFEIYNFIKNNNIDIVHTHSSKAGILGRWAAKLAKVKVIIHTVHGWSFNDYQSSLRRIFFIFLEKITAQFTHRLIVVSNYDKQKGLDNRIGKDDKYIPIHYGINYTEFDIREQGIRKELGIDTKDLVVAMISCLKPQKSPQDFIKLAYLVNQTMPQVKFILVGDGLLRKRIEKLINRLNLQNNVILTGWRWDISRILSATDIFVLTSLWEGLPISVLEAMASSKPVIATHTGGVAEVVVEAKTGFLTTAGDIKNISKRLIMLLRDEGLRKEIGQNAKSSLDFKFNLENMINQTHDLYNNLILGKEMDYVN